MKITVGEQQKDFRIVLDDGTDVTKSLRVCQVRVALDCRGPARVWLQCYATVEAQISEGKLTVSDPGDIPPPCPEEFVVIQTETLL